MKIGQEVIVTFRGIIKSINEFERLVQVSRLVREEDLVYLNSFVDIEECKTIDENQKTQEEE